MDFVSAKMVLPAVHSMKMCIRDRLYNDPIAKDIIRVYYPKNGESWISWNKEYSIDIKVNLSKGTEYGCLLYTSKS